MSSEHRVTISGIQEARKWAWNWLVDNVPLGTTSRNILSDSLAKLLLAWERRNATLPPPSSGGDDDAERLQDALDLLRVVTDHLPPSHGTRVSAERFLANNGTFRDGPKRAEKADRPALGP